MHQNIPLAIGLAVIGSFCFALAAKVQHGAVRKEVSDNVEEKALGVGQLWRVLHDPVWWAGIGLMTASLICQVIGLSMAPVSVYQPVQLLAFPWSVALTYQAMGPNRRRVLAPTILTVAATAAFVVIVSSHVAPGSNTLEPGPLAIGAGVVYAVAIAFAVIASRGPMKWRCLMWSSGGALFYGLEAALTRAIMQYATTSGHVWWQNPVVWIILPALIIGSALAGLMGQHGYATGSPDVVVAAMTVTSPVVGVVFGMAVLGEGVKLPPAATVFMVVLGVMAIVGVAVQAHVSQTNRLAVVGDAGASLPVRP